MLAELQLTVACANVREVAIFGAAVRWPRSFEQKFRVVKWIVGRG
jgi:hypothetical protein